MNVVSHPALPDACEGETWGSVLPPPLDGRDALLLVADEPIRGAVWELATRGGYDVFACRSPLDVIDTLVGAGDRLACVVLESTVPWGTGLRELLAEEYPKLDTVILIA
jgi:hypothetical protein